ncbi:MAG: GGDEF domain-containing protein [Gammaproteobacteria bacterium]|nr:GGDEF domain-containing protein [Gammaproteobacteria bacterium]
MARRARRTLLRFPDPELERQFLLSYRAAARPWIRMSLVVALSTVLGFTIIDHWLLVGPRLARPDIWRFGLQLPLVLIMLGLTGPRPYLRWYQPAIQIAAPLFGIGTVLMAVEATPAQLPLVAARLLLAAFYFYFMLGLGFNAALRSNAVLLLAYAFAAVSGAIAPVVATYSLFVLLCANFIGGAGCYALEYANRIAFLERRRLAEVATHDGLTGLLNRAALEEQARSLWQHAQLAHLPVSLLLIDIDHFKAYNDRYGHQEGDRCLREVATAVRSAARRRPLDVVARYGGEEIIAILIDSGRADAAAAADSVCRAVAELGIAHAGSGTRSYVTVSIGVATVEPGGDYSHEPAVRLADQALYATKARGRDGWSHAGSADAAAATAVTPVPRPGEAPAGEAQPLDEAQAAELLKTAS